jgi:hypothetical protein
MLPTVDEMEAYIRAKAAELGIDPDVAVKVAKGEGLKKDTWQANAQLDYGRERSYGPFQLHRAPAGYRQGMGNDFYNDTGLDPADTSTWKPGVDYALGKAKKGGWGPWFGAKAQGITGMMGIGGQPSHGTLPPRPTETVAQPGGLLEPENSSPVNMADVSPSQEETTIPGSGQASKWAAGGKALQQLSQLGQEDVAPFQWLRPDIAATGYYKPYKVQFGGLLG